jgi:hypothetical protein
MADDEPKRRRSSSAGEGSGGGKDDGFEERLKPYGLAPEDVFQEDLIAPPNQVLHLSSDRGQTEAQGIVTLQPRSIDDVKRWIGVPDEVARRRRPREEPAAISLVGGPSEIRNLRQPQLRGLYQAGEAYVHGDSSAVASYKGSLDQLVVDARIIGVFVRQDVNVYGVLELGDDVKLLWARNVRIWPSGSIRLLGNSKIDCLAIEGVPTREISPEVEAHVPKLGRLRALEVEHA